MVSAKVVIYRSVIHETCFPFAFGVSNLQHSTSFQPSVMPLRPIIVNLQLFQEHQGATSFGTLPQFSSSSLQNSSQHIGTSRPFSSVPIAQDPYTVLVSSSYPATVSNPSMLHVHSSQQLEILLPNIGSLSSSDIIPANTSHSIQTRLKTGTITRKDYITFAAIFPQIQSLTLHDSAHFLGGFTFLANITNSSEPSSFRVTSQIP